MNIFYINNDRWSVELVSPDDSVLIDRTGIKRLATTDPVLKRIFISYNIRGTLLKRVLFHEIGHCMLISYGIINDICKRFPEERWLEVEECLCNYIADHLLESI